MLSPVSLMNSGDPVAYMPENNTTQAIHKKNTVLLLGIGNEHKVGERKEFMRIPLPFLFTESIFDVFALFDVAHKAEKTKTKNK